MDTEKNARMSKCENEFAYSHMLMNRRDVAGMVPGQNEKKNRKVLSGNKQYISGLLCFASFLATPRNSSQ
jgi:hypothetical protein